MEHMSKTRRSWVRALARVAGAALIGGYAITVAASSQVSADRTITWIGIYTNFAFVIFTPAVPNLEGCPYTTGDEVVIDWTNDPNAKGMYATALAAYLAGQKVGFGVNGCHAGGAPLAYRIDVKP